MASCITSQWVNYAPQARLTVTQTSQTDTTVTLSWTLEYVTHGYTASTNGYDRAWSVTIDGGTADSGGTNINGKSTYTVASGTKTVNKTHSSRSISFSCSFEFDVTWSNVYGGTQTASGSISIPAKTSYTVSYNLNGGTGNFPAQGKWHGEALTIPNYYPARTGYTFLGWGVTNRTDIDETYKTQPYYYANSEIYYDDNQELIAIWQENALTVIYFANYADYCTYEGKEVAVDTTISYSQVHTDIFYYDNSYDAGLTNVQNKEYLYLSRTGYTPTGYWIEENTTNKIHENVEQPVTGQQLALLLGTSLESGNATVNVYADWRENILTVRYHSNYATYAEIDGAVNAEVSADKDVVVRTYNEFKYATSFEYGLHDYSTEGDMTYLTRTRYDAVGYWGTAPEIEIGNSTDDVIVTNNGIAISEKKSFTTGQELAEALGISLEDGDKEINLYAQWVLRASMVTVYDSDGNAHRGLCHIYTPNTNFLTSDEEVFLDSDSKMFMTNDGGLKYAIITVYDENGNARIVV